MRPRDWLWTGVGIGVLIASRLLELDSPRGWFAPYPAVMRLLAVHQTLLALAVAWAALRSGRLGAPIALIFTLLAGWGLLDAGPSALLGLSLLLLAVIALLARPWPNRPAMARCVALAGFAVTIAAVAGL